jgi:mono/diheme cytochrome c family protein
VDERRGWVFCATGSATDDFYGAFRKGSDLFSDSVLALDAATGRRKWHYQTVHHDLWDYDNPPAPILATLTVGGTARDVVVQLTKMGFTYVLDRETGESLFPVQELPVPASTVPGESAWPTQPFPLKPRPLVRQSLSEADLTAITPDAHAYALREFRRYQAGSIFTPPTLQGTITQPGHLGGSEWHGASFDPNLNVLYVNVNDAPTINRLRPVQTWSAGTSGTPVQLGRLIYERTCSTCHGPSRLGAPPITPPLLNLALSGEAIRSTILQGRNAMPAFRQFTPAEMAALVAYVTSPAGTAESDRPAGAPDRYTLEAYTLFTTPDGIPAVAPPWGTLNAIDLVSGDLLWKVPLGEYPQLVAKGIRGTGTMNYGGAVATAGGLVFIAATADEKIRAFESHSGRVLWEARLPAGGYATPSVYMVRGRQFVAVAAGGGGKNATKSGDAIVAFALPPGGESARVIHPASGQPPAWTDVFDGSTLAGWVHLNGAHQYSVEDGAIVGRTVARSASQNSFLCSEAEFGDFELELQTMVDRVTNQGIQIRTRVRPVPGNGRGWDFAAGRVYGPQVEVRRFYPGLPTTGLLYGEALGTGWLSSQDKIDHGHHFFVDEGWNAVRIVADGPRIQTWVNGHPVEDLALDAVYRTHPSGHVCLQLHGLTARELAAPPWDVFHVPPGEPLVSRWRQIRIRPLR